MDLPKKSVFTGYAFSTTFGRKTIGALAKYRVYCATANGDGSYTMTFGPAFRKPSKKQKKGGETK